MKINGPIEVVYVGTALCIIMTVLLLTGKGSWLIAGYNTASKEEKEHYDKKKLCLITGSCMTIIDIILLVLCFFHSKLPESFGYIFIGVVLVTVIINVLLSNTICKRK